MPSMRWLPGLVLLACLLLVAPAHAADAAATKRLLDREMRRAGSASGALVVDLATGRSLHSSRASTERVPASVNKLNTTAAALLRFGPQATLETTVLALEGPGPDGVLDGDLWLHGGGDPSFDAPEARALARRLAATGLRRITGAVRGDESLFDARRGPNTARPSDWLGPLSASGFPAPRWAAPAQTASTAFAAALRAAGVRVAAKGAIGAAPGGAVTLGSWPSPTMAELAALANVRSDNYVAEMLLKGLGARFGGTGTTPAGARVARATLAGLGVRARISDGSGLSRANRMAPGEVVDLLGALDASPLSASFEASLPVAGRTGTLETRLRRSPAQDACRAKTGSLIGVSALAGYCTTRTGARVAFAILMNRVSVPFARALQDRMVTAIAGYDGIPAQAPAEPPLGEPPPGTVAPAR
jgi:D-alanyl-D-alanine carboxypeptidase/D-alanyl-D-alanine-endopeptidase (penicillin-binding protein 4)